MSLKGILLLFILCTELTSCCFIFTVEESLSFKTQNSSLQTVNICVCVFHCRDKKVPEQVGKYIIHFSLNIDETNVMRSKQVGLHISSKHHNKLFLATFKQPAIHASFLPLFFIFYERTSYCFTTHLTQQTLDPLWKLAFMNYTEIWKIKVHEMRIG